MEVGRLLVDEECIRNPDEVDVLSTDDQLLQARAPLERQPGVSPELSGANIVKLFTSVIYEC